MEVKDDFYLTLVSESSDQETPSDFNVILNPQIVLDGPFEVALTEIYLPDIIHNILHTDIYIKVTVGKLVPSKSKGSKTTNLLTPTPTPIVQYKTQEVKFKAGRYEIEKLIKAMNSAINTVGDNCVVFDFDRNAGKFKVVAQDYCSISFPPMSNLPFILGCYEEWKANGAKFKIPSDKQFQESHERRDSTDTTVIATSQPNLNNDLTNLYVYCDCVEPQIVNTTMTRLLRLVPYISRFSASRFEFRHKQYLHVSSNVLRRIHIGIKNNRGDAVKFASTSETVCRLHFRPRV